MRYCAARCQRENLGRKFCSFGHVCFRPIHCILQLKLHFLLELCPPRENRDKSEQFVHFHFGTIRLFRQSKVVSSCGCHVHVYGKDMLIENTHRTVNNDVYITCLKYGSGLNIRVNYLYVRSISSSDKSLIESLQSERDARWIKTFENQIIFFDYSLLINKLAMNWKWFHLLGFFKLELIQFQNS